MKLFNRLFNKQSEREIIAGMRNDVDDMGFYISEIEKRMSELDEIHKDMMKSHEKMDQLLKEMKVVVSKVNVINLTDRLDNNLVKVENLIEKVGESK